MLKLSKRLTSNAGGLVHSVTFSGDTALSTDKFLSYYTHIIIIVISSLLQITHNYLWFVVCSLLLKIIIYYIPYISYRYNI